MTDSLFRKHKLADSFIPCDVSSPYLRHIVIYIRFPNDFFQRGITPKKEKAHTRKKVWVSFLFWEMNPYM